MQDEDFDYFNLTLALRDQVHGRTVLVVCLRWTGMLMVLVLSSPTKELSRHAGVDHTCARHAVSRRCSTWEFLTILVPRKPVWPHCSCHKTLWEAEGKDSVEGATVNFNVFLIQRREINRANIKTVRFKHLQI